MEEMLIMSDEEIERQKNDLLNKRDELLRKMESIESHSDSLHQFRSKFSSLQLENKPSIKITNQVKQNVAVNGLKKGSQVKQNPGANKHTKAADIPIIEPISKSEFLSIPQYMRGRITHEILNQALSSFLDTLKAKYQLLGTSNSKLTEEQAKRNQMYKSQENSETVGHYFCTVDDLKLYSFLKELNNIKNILTCLRHCKRVKEIRGPGKIIRYAIPK